MSDIPVEDLESLFKCLGNINRLRLLVELQTPLGYGDIDLAPSRGDYQGSGDRTISRQAVRNHVQSLLDHGLVREIEGEEGEPSRFIVDRPRLFAALQQMSRLATVHPVLSDDAPTMDLDVDRGARDVKGPHLVLVRGVEEGRVFPLEGDEGPWVVGRNRDAQIPLDYDAYVSGEHARILRRGGGYLLQDLPRNRNGTFLNWVRLDAGGTAPLEPGDVIGVGLSFLVFRG